MILQSSVLSLYAKQAPREPHGDGDGPDALRRLDLGRHHVVGRMSGRQDFGCGARQFIHIASRKSDCQDWQVGCSNLRSKNRSSR